MKKQYITPELVSVKVEVSQMLCTSDLRSFKLYNDEDDEVDIDDAL